MSGLKLLITKGLGLIRGIQTDMKVVCKQYPQEIKNGWLQGKRLAKQKDLSIFNSLKARTIGAARKLKPQPEYLPGLCAGIGTIIPLPLTSVAGYGVGKGLQYLIK